METFYDSYDNAIGTVDNDILILNQLDKPKEIYLKRQAIFLFADNVLDMQKYNIKFIIFYAKFPNSTKIYRFKCNANLYYFANTEIEKYMHNNKVRYVEISKMEDITIQNKRGQTKLF